MARIDSVESIEENDEDSLRETHASAGGTKDEQNMDHVKDNLVKKAVCQRTHPVEVHASNDT